MKVEELLQMLQEKGMDDNSIRALLSEAIGALDKDFKEHDEKEDEMDDEKAEASRLLGVQL